MNSGWPFFLSYRKTIKIKTTKNNKLYKIQQQHTRTTIITATTTTTTVKFNYISVGTTKSVHTYMTTTTPANKKYCCGCFFFCVFYNFFGKPVAVVAVIFMLPCSLSFLGVAARVRWLFSFLYVCVFRKL